MRGSGRNWRSGTAKRERFTIGPFEAVGKSKTAARDRAIADASLALEGSFAPVVVAYRNYILLVWREAIGWSYTIMHGPKADRDLVERERCYGITTSKRDREETLRAGLLHLAQWAFEYEDGERSPVPLPDAEACYQHASWAAWQIRYHAAACELEKWLGFQRPLPTAISDLARDVADEKLTINDALVKAKEVQP